MPASSFADNICLIAFHQSLLKILTNKCHNYSKRGDMNLIILKVVSSHLVRVNPPHCKFMKEREWALGDDMVEELYEYKNLVVLKNYCGSFASNISDNIDKTRKKAGMILSSNVDRHKTNPLIYVKSWSPPGGRLGCPPSCLVLNYLRLLPACCLSLNV